MVQKIKNIVTALAVASAFLVPVAVPAAAFAQAGTSTNIDQGLCGGAELQFTSQPCQAGAATTRLNDIITTIINIVSIVVGVVAVIMIIIGGLRYITSGGESSNVSSAKNTIIYAIVGLVVVALAQFIVRFVLDRTINGGNNGGILLLHHLF